MFYSHDFDVYYSDVDKNNKLKLCSLFNMFQEMGCLHSDYAGIGINDIPRTHFAWLVINWKAEIFKLPSWGSKIHAVTWSRHNGNIYACRDFEFYDEHGNLISKCSSKWVTVDVRTGHLNKLTDNIITSFKPEEKQVFNDSIEKLKEPENSDLAFNYTILRKDIDTNNHMNNNYYLQLALEALPNDKINSPIHFVEIMYKHAAKLGDTISCLYSANEKNEQIITIKSNGLSTLHAIIKLS